MYCHLDAADHRHPEGREVELGGPEHDKQRRVDLPGGQDELLGRRHQVRGRPVEETAGTAVTSCADRSILTQSRHDSGLVTGLLSRLLLHEASMTLIQTQTLW